MLAAVPFKPSRIFWRLEGYCYGLFALGLMWAMWPYLFAYPWLGIILVAIQIFIWSEARRRFFCRPWGSLEFSSQGWSITTPQGSLEHMTLKGEVVIWSRLVILVFEERNSKRRIQIILGEDSTTAADFSRLRCWLKATLIPKV